MMITKGERIVLKKIFGSLNAVGEVYEVAHFTEDSVVIRTSNTKIAVASISFKDFDEYFIREAVDTSWTKWITVGEANNLIGYYKTNGKKVVFKTVAGIKAMATCCKEDTFNLGTGVMLAYQRCLLKEMKMKRQEILKKIDDDYKALHSVESEIKEQKDMLKRMLRGA